MSALYDIGDVVRSTATFYNTEDVATDPSAVSVSYSIDGGTATDLVYGEDDEVVKSSTGVYYLDFTIAERGTYYVTWTGSGAVTTSQLDIFNVRKQVV